jgi:hypothetical protein
VSFAYSDMDRLIIERWSDIVGLIEAHRETQDRIEEMIDIVGQRMTRWARPHGYEVEADGKWAEFRFVKTSWIDKRRGPKIHLAVGGFCPTGYKKMDADHPYLFVYTRPLSEFRLKEAEISAFSHALRTALGADARAWEAPGVDDVEEPLGRYLNSMSDADRTRLVASEDALFDFVVEQAPTLFALSPAIDAELGRLGK